MAIPNKSIDFVIIGAAKAGTTSLASWLSKHPDVCMSSPKETMFFGSPKLFDRGLAWFHTNFFSHYQGESLLGDATPAYSDRDRHPGTPERVLRTNQNTKIIYIVRNPLRKVESSWQMYSNLSFDNSSTNEHRLYCIRAREGFQSYVSDPHLLAHFMSVCSYQYQLDAWNKHFPRRHILVMFLEDLATDRAKELSRLCNFLDLNVEPLLDAQLRAENTLQDRRKPHWFTSYIGKYGIHRLLPAPMRKQLSKSRLFSAPQVSLLKPTWPGEVLSEFTSRVQPNVKNFLRTNGKSEVFYTF
ncbi:MAG: sulfotransferase domain-containing protein [Cyanobium sp. M30B3]|nr:MAG: sulfotransferase domain-containing protein [Cyanobium sp. M30B3]